MKTQLLLLEIFFGLLFLVSCRNKIVENTKVISPPALFHLMENTGINFSNDVKDTKDFNIFTYRNFYNGAGVAIGDINNDGLPDIFFTSNMGSNKLYLNKGDFHFEDITNKSGLATDGKWGTGVVMVDINNDGWLDIYVCYAGIQKGRSAGNELYINNHDNTFTESAKEYGLNDSGYTTHAAFFDYDGDGDLDCFIINNSFIPVNTLNYANKRGLPAKDWPVPDFLKGGGNRLLRNDNGHFKDVTNESGIHSSLISFGLGVTVGDVNGDGWPDVYVSNDFFERDYLYINQKNGKFKDELENYMQHTSLASMGADMGDINNDGYPDIFTTDMLPDDDYRLKTTSLFDNIDVYQYKVNQGFYHQFMQNTLQLNNKNGKFMDIAHYSGVAASDWSWGGLMFDMDNDGRNDLFVCNGINHDVTDQDFIDFFANDIIQKMVMTGKREEIDQIISRMPSHPLLSKAFHNLGNLKFEDIGKTWGFTTSSFSNGAAYADLDNDGDLDLVVNNVNQKAFIYKNRSRELNNNNYIGIYLKGKGKNTFAVGSKIKIFQGNQILSRDVIPSRGFQSSVDYKQIIGLGKGGVDSMIIIWPNRSISRFIHPDINKVYLLNQADYQSVPIVTKPQVKTLLQLTKQNFDRHKEDEFNDFYYDRGLPMKLSHEGPKAAYGDVNGDGLIDIYLCGANGQGGQLYLQTANGQFVKKEEKIFQLLSSSEDVTALFFDCDGDGDLDLIVGSGGNKWPPGSVQYNNRLYKNDGKGNFELDQNALPPTGMNTAVIIANDFNGDGYPDLFVGSRSVPMNYGVTPESFLLLNNGKGRFTNIAKIKNPDIANIGLVTDAVWADVTGDGKKDLIIVGEWMTPRVFSYNGDHFVEVKTNLNNLYGWWQTISVADLNNDGKEDLILGNIGENFYLEPNAQNQVKLWLKDFDNNGSIDKVISRTYHGRDVPVFLKRDITTQIVSLKKQNLKYSDFANKSIQDLFTEDELKNAEVKLFNYSSSCIAINQGSGLFTIQKLPSFIQFSSLNKVLCTDLNGDGNIDLILGGNKFDFQPQFCRLDASYGEILINDGKSNFTRMEPAESGLEIRGMVKDIVDIPGKTNNYIIFLQNDDFPVLYKIKKQKR